MAVSEALLWVFRGEADEEGAFYEYRVPAGEGMVVLDAIHWIQEHVQPDLAVRWNCKAAKCGSCSAEVNGRPRLLCKTRLSDYPDGEAITVEPMRAFPRVRDLVTDVSWNYRVNERITPFTPPTDVPQEEWRWQQEDVERVQEFRKCIECFLCQDVCHVLRNHETSDEFIGPRFLIRNAGLEMHPMDQADRRAYLKHEGGIGYCNINKCCSDVCPEHIRITDNGIIPLKERVADEYYDPLRMLWRKLRGQPATPASTGNGHATHADAAVAAEDAAAVDVTEGEPAVEHAPIQRERRAGRADRDPGDDPGADGSGASGGSDGGRPSVARPGGPGAARVAGMGERTGDVTEPRR